MLKKQVMLWEFHWTVLRHSIKTRLFKKLMQILNDPTHPGRHYFDSRRSNKSGRFLLPKTNTNVIRPRTYPLFCQFLMKIIIVINLVCACVKTSAEGDHFQSLSERERERQTDRQTDRQRQRQRQRQREEEEEEERTFITRSTTP